MKGKVRLQGTWQHENKTMHRESMEQTQISLERPPNVNSPYSFSLTSMAPHYAAKLQPSPSLLHSFLYLYPLLYCQHQLTSVLDKCFFLSSGTSQIHSFFKIQVKPLFPWILLTFLYFSCEPLDWSYHKPKLVSFSQTICLVSLTVINSTGSSLKPLSTSKSRSQPACYE